MLLSHDNITGAVAVWSLNDSSGTATMMLRDGHDRPITAMILGNRSDVLITATRDAVRRWRVSPDNGPAPDNGAALAAELGSDEPAAVCLDAEDRLVAVASGRVISLLQVPGTR